MSLLTGLERNMKCYKKEFDENADSSKSRTECLMFMFAICKRVRSIDSCFEQKLNEPVWKYSLLKRCFDAC